MAKLMQIKLSSKEILSEVKRPPADKNNLSIREIELLVLENLFVAAANSQKELKKMNECYDLVEQVKNLADNKLELNLTKADIDYLEKAIEITSSSRPGFWFHAREMFKSIEKPVEVEK